MLFWLQPKSFSSETPGFSASQARKASLLEAILELFLRETKDEEASAHLVLPQRARGLIAGVGMMKKSAILVSLKDFRVVLCCFVVFSLSFGLFGVIFSWF